MKMKNITLVTSLLILALISFGTVAADSHLDEAIQHAQAAATSSDSKAVVQHATEAITHAKAAKNDKTDSKHINEGLKCLDDAVKEGNAGNIDAAKKEATDAVKHFKQAAK